MEHEFLNILETIRGYIFIIMLTAIIWAVLRFIESILKIKTEYQKVDQANFALRMNRYLDAGKYDQAIDWCKDKLAKYPNNLDANWYVARAYYLKEENDLSRQYFEYTLYLAPSWEDSVGPYLEKLDANKTSQPTANASAE